ncbi:SDR family oxidoreductase [Corynebacterium sp. 335C]
MSILPFRTRVTHGPSLPAASALPGITTGRALVTGASSGIGRATAEALRDAGYEVFGTSRRGADAPAPEGVTMLPLDLGDPASVEALVASFSPGGDFARRDSGPLMEVVVCNAGESQSGAFEELPREDLERLFQVNVLGHVDLVQRLLPSMRRAGTGRVVVVGSMLGSLPLAYRSSYVATKAALSGFARALRGEVARFGIGVTVVEPGSINTGLSERRTRLGGGEGSPYRTDVHRMLEKLDANEASGISAEEVAAVIVDEILSDRPAAYRARGSRAGVVVPLTRILPEQLRLELLKRVHGLS